jgi:hypothetical protein
MIISFSKSGLTLGFAMSTPESSQAPRGDPSSVIRIGELEAQVRNGGAPNRVHERVVENFLK